MGGVRCRWRRRRCFSFGGLHYTELTERDYRELLPSVLDFLNDRESRPALRESKYRAASIVLSLSSP
jgi:hypothetical protein